MEPEMEEQEEFEQQTEPDKRMAGSYEITNSIHIGDSEVVFGEDSQNEMPYLCAFCKTNALFESYQECMVGDDYVEMVELFAERVKEQCIKVREAQEKVTVPREKITADMCLPMNSSQNLIGKVMAVKADALRPEYRTADHQLIYVTGGHGAMENSLGSACFYTNLYSGEHGRWERRDLQGEVKRECLPEWAVERVLELRSREATKEQGRREQKPNVR